MTDRDNDGGNNVIVPEVPRAAPDDASNPAEDVVMSSGNGTVPAEPKLEDVPDISFVPPPPPSAGVVVSPDGTTAAVIQPDPAGTLRLWLAPLDGGEATVLELDLELTVDAHGPRWSPDGSQLALSAPHPADGRPAIWVVTIATGLARVLVEHNARDTSPIWSPDGEWIGFLSERDGRVSASVVRSDGLSGSIQVSHADRGFNDHSPTWSRDSKKLAFARRVVDGEKRGDHIWTVEIATGAVKQVTTRVNGRHSLTWAPDRNLIMHVADDNEWDQIAVVNADNSSGWNIAAEKGDKSEPRWSHDGQRVVYLRRHEGVVRCCERGTSTANAEVIDPGEGVCSSAQFLPDKRVLYVYQAPASGPRVIVQEPKADAERTTLPIIPDWDPGRELATPYRLEFEINEIHTGALVYRRTEQEGDVPAVIVLRDRPNEARTAVYDALEQALASTGMAVFVPTFAGSPGEGRKLSNSLSDRRETEAELFDLLAFVNAVSSIGGIDASRIGVVGRGHGGALALVLAGSRPDAIHAVAAIDPLTDWDAELDHADGSMRDWTLRNLGLPATNQGAFAVRTPTTYAGIIEAPLLLMGSDTAPEGRSSQLDAFAALLRELDRPFEQDVSVSEPEWTAMRRVATFMREALISAGREVAVGEAVTADAV